MGFSLSAPSSYTRGQLAAARYVEYDPELGWVSRPNVYIPDMYGKGVYLRTNWYGSRSDVEQRTKVPDGKVRIICSGDSFTFGYGVDNDHAWCRSLASSMDESRALTWVRGAMASTRRISGIDVMAGGSIRPFTSLHSSMDFRRMGSDRFFDYGKPTLAIRGSALPVENVPVPRRPFYVPSFRAGGHPEPKTYESG